MGTEADVEDAEGALGSEELAVTTVNSPAYVSVQFLSVTDSNGVNVTGNSWIKCASNQVMVGFHGSQMKGLCMTLPAGTQTLFTHIDAPGAGSTQVVAGGTAMHGCPGGSYIQGIYKSGSSEWLFCSTFNFGYSSNIRLDTGSQSNVVYGISNPQSHVCGIASKIFDPWGIWTGGWNAEAMVGIHQGKNYFACVK